MSCQLPLLSSLSGTVLIQHGYPRSKDMDHATARFRARSAIIKHLRMVLATPFQKGDTRRSCNSINGLPAQRPLTGHAGTDTSILPDMRAYCCGAVPPCVLTPGPPPPSDPPPAGFGLSHPARQPRTAIIIIIRARFRIGFLPSSHSDLQAGITAGPPHGCV